MKTTKPHRFRCIQCSKELSECACARCGWCGILLDRDTDAIAHLDKQFHRTCWFTLEEASKEGVTL